MMENPGPIEPGPYDDNPVSEWQESRLVEPNRTNGLEVTTRNESAGGYCIRWSTENHPPKVKIGELLGIGGADQHPSYSLGVIRSLHSNDQSELDLELQIISNHVAATLAYEAKAEGRVPLRKKRDPITCLTLEADLPGGKKASPSIVFGSATHQVGSHLWLEDSINGIPRLIRLTRLVDFSSVYARFEFEYVEPDHTGDPGHEEQEHDEFESLWNTL